MVCNYLFDALAGFCKNGELERDDTMGVWMRNASLGLKRGKMIAYYEVVNQIKPQHLPFKTFKI
jgi:hypothetical protein